MKVAEIRYRCMYNDGFLCAIQFVYNRDGKKSPFYSGSCTAKQFETKKIKVNTDQQVRQVSFLVLTDACIYGIRLIDAHGLNIVDASFKKAGHPNGNWVT